MSQTHINYNDKYYREHRFSSSGIIETNNVPSLNKNKNQFLSTENTLRITVKDVNPGNVLEVQVKLLTETDWTTLGTVNGSTSSTFDIRSWDMVRYEVTTFDAPSTGMLYASGFIAPLEQSPDIADCVRICDSLGNEIELELVDGIYSLPTIEQKPPCAPTVTNATIAATNTIYSHTFTNGTKKIMIQQRESANVEFAFENTLASHISLPKGTTYTEENLNLQGVTIYFRSDKIGTLEILEWS